MDTTILNGIEKLPATRTASSLEGKNEKISNQWEFSKVAIVENKALVEAEIFEMFLQERLPAIRVKDFLSQSMSTLCEGAALEYSFEMYESAPEVGIIGISLVDNPDLGGYLKKAEFIRKSGFCFDLSLSLLNQIMGFISNATGRKCQIFKIRNMLAWAGVWRLLTNGAGIHVDNICSDCPELSEMKIEFQGSLVLHISTTGNGGSTILYDKVAMEEDKEDKLFQTSGWKYSSKIVQNTKSITVPAITGELVFLPTRKYHEVTPSKGSSERISFSSFFFIKKDDPTLYFYS
jgi:hypothetical protein